MTWYSQLTRLIFDFYRENPEELIVLRGLGTCKLSRWWGTFRINCSDSQTATALIDAIELLREPIAQLRLAQSVRIMVNGKAIANFPVQVANFCDKSFKKN